jgi:replicative DNA helicase
MGANLEHQALCKIIETGDFHTVEKFKIDDTYFIGDQTQYKEIFRYLRAYYHNPASGRTIPSWHLIQPYFPGFPWIQTYDNLPTLLHELRKQKLRAQIIAFNDELMAKVEADPMASLDVIKEASTRLQIEHEHTNDSLITDSFDSLRQEYDLVKANQGITGIATPWEVLNDDTQGIQKEDFIIIFGRPKSMKSWIAFLIATYAYYWQRLRVLVWSNEMSRISCLRRMAAIITMIDYEKFKKAKLDPASEQRVFETLQWLRDQEHYYRHSSGNQAALLVTSPHESKSDNAMGVSALQAKMEEFKPHLVVVDGMYLMRDDREKRRSIDWKMIAHISQDLKGTTKAFKIPMVATTQANRTAKNPNDKEADLSELAYADAIAQDCDLAMRVHKQKDRNGDTELMCSLPGSREGKLDGFVIHGHPAVNFQFKRLTLKDPDAPEEPSKNSQSRRSQVAPVAHPVPTLPNWRKI